MGRTAYDFDAYANRDLRRYLRNFELPKPPLGDVNFLNLKADVLYGKSHENGGLSVRHAKWRVLENISSFTMGDLSIKKWLDSNIPVKPLSPTNHERYNLPTVLHDLWINVPSEIEGMSSWLCLALVTATRVLHSTFPKMVSSSFSYPDLDKHDKSRFRYFIWAPDGQDPRQKCASVVVAYQTPYTLTQHDMLEFVSCKSFPAFDENAKDKLSAKYRLWGKVWDTCKAWQSEFFVLTSYTQWAFGFFSEGGREAFVSDVFQSDCVSPTILELLTYWIASSMHAEGTLKRPKVYEPILDDVDMEATSFETIPRAPRSESAWPGQYEEPGESAVEDLHSLLSGEGSLKSVPGDQNGINVDIQKWLATCRTARHRRLDEDDLHAPLMPEFELELDSDFIPNKPLGEWMVVS